MFQPKLKKTFSNSSKNPCHKKNSIPIQEIIQENVIDIIEETITPIVIEETIQSVPKNRLSWIKR
jgi:hypothetical protein